MSAPICTLVGHAYRGSDGAVTCCLCDYECEWEDCQGCAGDGGFDGYEEDPNYYHPGEIVTCNECRGEGGFWHCTNRECKTGEVCRILPERPKSTAPTKETT